MFITDVLVFGLMSRTDYVAYDRGLCSTRDHTKPVMSCQLDTSELVELLQQSAVEHLTKLRQLEEQEFLSVHVPAVGTNPSIIVTTDFEALYAYKCGEYQRCLQLSRHNVCTLLSVIPESQVYLYPEFIQLMDDNIVSLIALTLIVDISRVNNVEQKFISQLHLSLYLMYQCRMKLHHSATSLAQILRHLAVANRLLLSRHYTLNQLLLKLTERTIQNYLVILRQCFTFSVFVSTHKPLMEIANVYNSTLLVSDCKS